eukprot:TRINITY_DN1943_c0_g1_i1.p2 TRINITY_DN1943_c0_g1~~TRINITY_DN1943_c0_g1_i1.p2  ORF type:complete len:696 (+),score=109.46 TRINITY_DN1943_c0_g1_i1:287-2374(+)
MVFGLADLFKNFDAGKYYGTFVIVKGKWLDMAERIHSQWKAKAKAEREKGAKMVLRTLRRRAREILREVVGRVKYIAQLKELQEEKEKLGAYLENVIKENEMLDKTRKDHKEPRTMLNNHLSSQYLSSESDAERHKVKGSIFNKLHSEATTKQEIKQMNEEIKKTREMQGCTFKPRIRSEVGHYPSETRSAVYERLSQSNKLQRQQYYEMQKSANEIKHCTFQPQLPKAKPRRASQSAIGLDEPVYDRLHRHAEVIDQVRQAKALAKKESEVESCTFVPRINRGACRSMSQDSRGNRFDELYMKHAEKKQKIAKKALEREEKVGAKCPFRPNLNLSKCSFGGDSEVLECDMPRYERLYSKHAQKEKMLEQKRRELAEEEKKLRAFASKKVLKEKQNNKEEEPFTRLYSQDKVYRQKKSELSKKLMQEMGVSFTPRINNTSIQLSENDSRGVIERNEQFLKEKNTKLSKQVPTELKECTFVPKVGKSGGKKESGPRLPPGERLYAYFEKYEKQKEEYRQKHLYDQYKEGGLLYKLFAFLQQHYYIVAWIVSLNNKIQMVSKDHPELMEEIVPRPIIKSYVEESPEAPDSEKRDAFFEHKKQFLIITAAGKPIFTRYGEEGGVSALCASFAAVIPKLQNQYYDQRLHTSLNTIRYIKTSQMLAVFLFKRNLVYIGLSKSGHSYTFLQRQLEVLHTQV